MGKLGLDESRKEERRKDREGREEDLISGNY